MLLCAIVLTLPLHKKLIPWVMGIYFLVFLINGGIQRILKNVDWKYIMITTGYYVFLLFGILYSHNFNAALFDVEVKFSLFILPLIFSGLKLSSKQFSDVLLWFIIGCFVAIIISVTMAISNYLNTSDLSSFYYQKLSAFHHPSYFSMYLNFCICIIYYFMLYDKENFRIKSDVVSVSIILIFALFVVLLSSKIGMITLLLVVFSGAVLWFIKSRAFYLSIVVFLMISAVIYLSFKYSNKMQVRMQEAVNSVVEEQESYSTTAARILIWKCGIELFLESPVLGYGTGDVKHELKKKYKKYEYTYLEETELNAHNQFIQMLIAIGLFGSLFFWAYLFYPLFDRSFYSNIIYLGFLMLILLNF